jgi:hypothetical protein
MASEAAITTATAARITSRRSSPVITAASADATGCPWYGSGARPRPAAPHRAAAVEHGRPEVLQRTAGVGQVGPAAVQPAERFLDDVFGARPVAEHDVREPH